MKPSASSNRGRVLLADDSAVVRTVVGGYLRSAGFEVDEAADGPEAMRLLESRAYDVVVTDLHMPAPDGFAILETVKLRDLGVEVVILTGSLAKDINAAIRALRLGAHDYLTKPLAGPDQAILSVERAIEKKRHREALRAAEERYRLLFDNVPIGLYRTTPSGDILDANLTLVQMLGFPSREALLTSNAETLYVNPEDRRRWQRLLESEGIVSRFQVAIRRYDGTIVWMEENTRAFHDDGERPAHYEGSLEDISERKRAEEDLREAQKMDAVGRLAGGVAHDFNNLIGVILASLDLMDRDVTQREVVPADYDRIRTAAEKAATLTQQLLAFGRRQVLQPKVTDLNDLVRGMRDLLESMIGESIVFETRLAPDLVRVKTDPSKLEQVIMNLALNARDAMPGGGRLTLETRNLWLDGAKGTQLGLKPGAYATITVIDTGTGMDAKTKSRIFEPFFTTKKELGSGLGLSMAYGIIKQGGGHLWVESDVGKGTSFTIFLPRTEEVAKPAVVEAARLRGPSGSETVLLAEDEDDLRRLLAQGLRMSGYDVLEAAKGPEALALASRHDGGIDLLVTDLVMPEMSGTVLAEHLKRSRPSIKVLFISGFTDNALLRRGVLAHPVAFLQKPFTLAALSRKVREVLDNPMENQPDAPAMTN
jgi:two-component system cell cycle sensor histidine kinase/response regulator CckA